jgi:hypothetical protein
MSTKTKEQIEAEIPALMTEYVKAQRQFDKADGRLVSSKYKISVKYAEMVRAGYPNSDIRDRLTQEYKLAAKKEGELLDEVRFGRTLVQCAVVAKAGPDGVRGYIEAGIGFNSTRKEWQKWMQNPHSPKPIPPNIGSSGEPVPPSAPDPKAGAIERARNFRNEAKRKAHLSDEDLAQLTPTERLAVLVEAKQAEEHWHYEVERIEAYGPQKAA